jgi:hypothetical protein
MDPGVTIAVTGITAFAVMVVAIYGAAAYSDRLQADLFKEDMKRKGYVCSKCKAKETGM